MDYHIRAADIFQMAAQPPTRSLQELVKQGNLQAVDLEIQRALDNVEKDPLQACCLNFDKV
jgi:hypothetical protein